MSTQITNHFQGNEMEKDLACRDIINEFGPAVETRLMSEACRSRFQVQSYSQRFTNSCTM